MTYIVSLPNISILMLAMFVVSGLALVSVIYRNVGKKNRLLDLRLETLSRDMTETAQEKQPDNNFSFFYADGNRLERLLGPRKRRMTYWLIGLLTLIVIFCVLFFTVPVVATTILVMVLGGIGVIMLWQLYCKRRKRFLFTAQLPEAIDIIIRGARVGMSIQENFQVIAREMPWPIGREFQIMGEKLGIGIDLETILLSTVEETNIKEFQFMATTLILQQKSGGQYAEVLENLNVVLRERRAQSMKAKAITSEARLSAKIVASVTVGILFTLALTNENQFKFLLEDPSGRSVLMYGVASTVIGFFIISQLLRTLR